MAIERGYCNFGFMVKPLEEWETKKTIKAFNKVLKGKDVKTIDTHKYPSTTLFIDIHRNARKMNSGWCDPVNEYMISLTYYRGYLLLTFLSSLDGCDLKEVDEIVNRLGDVLTLPKMRKNNGELVFYSMVIPKSRKPVIPQ